MMWYGAAETKIDPAMISEGLMKQQFVISRIRLSLRKLKPVPDEVTNRMRSLKVQPLTSSRDHAAASRERSHVPWPMASLSPRLHHRLPIKIKLRFSRESGPTLVAPCESVKTLILLPEVAYISFSIQFV